MSKIELCKFDSCTQCYACLTSCPKGCISMVDSKDGFVVPEINANICVECGACMKACHIITPCFTFQKPVKTYACWTKNTADREKSSSGGAFSVIARKIISVGGIVFGACMCEDLNVRHISVEKADDIFLLQGSKYVQSYLGDTYKKVRNELISRRKVLFTGTPCQVAGLYSYLQKPYDNLFTIDFVCHGVPPQSAFDIYVKKIGLNRKYKKINFRFTKGWGYQLSIQKDINSSRVLLPPSKTYYLRAFTNGLMFSEACYSCNYARPERVSDFTMGDYWGLGIKVPFNHKTHKGVSLLLLNTERSVSFINECNDLFFEERPFKEAIEGNYNLSYTSKRPLGRNSYFEESKILSVSELSKKYKIQASTRDYLRLLKQIIISYK